MSSLPITVQEPPGVQAALNSLLGTGTTAPTVTTVAEFNAVVAGLAVDAASSVSATATGANAGMVLFGGMLTANVYSGDAATAMAFHWATPP
jgi:hypothetical protein